METMSFTNHDYVGTKCTQTERPRSTIQDPPKIIGTIDFIKPDVGDIDVLNIQGNHGLYQL